MALLTYHLTILGLKININRPNMYLVCFYFKITKSHRICFSEITYKNSRWRQKSYKIATSCCPYDTGCFLLMYISQNSKSNFKEVFPISVAIYVYLYVSKGKWMKNSVILNINLYIIINFICCGIHIVFANYK